MLDISIYQGPSPTPLVEVPARGLSRGVYVARSRDAGYAALLAAVYAGHARLLADRTGRNGEREIVAEVGPRANPEFRLGSAFYGRSPGEYRNWQETWWREVVQNSVDAGATTIRLGAVENADKTWTVSCEDDGKGMSPQILEEVFFVVGETTKRGEATARGGFGRARELIIMPWPAWTIASGEVEYYSTGLRPGHSDVRKIPYLKGTRITATMSADLHTDDVFARAYLSKCSLPGVRFYVNGRVVATDADVGDLAKEWEGLARVYFRKGRPKVPAMHVRLGGLHMFDKLLDSKIKGYVYVEVLGKGTEVLTANRDGINTSTTRGWNLYTHLEDLTRELAIEKERAVKKSMHVEEKIAGEGLFAAKWTDDLRRSHLTASVGAVPEPGKDGSVTLSSDALADLGAAMQQHQDDAERAVDRANVSVAGRVLELQLAQVAFADPAAFIEMLKSMNLVGATHLDTAVKLAAWKRDFYIYSDLDDFRVPKRFYPGSMPPTVLRLAKVWAEICLYVMAQLKCNRPFGVGWHFSEHALASYYRSEGQDYLLLNPFVDVEARKDILRPTDPEHLRDLYARAVHEATHMASDESSHDVDFAIAMTRNVARTADGFRHVRKIVSQIKLRATKEAPETEARGGEERIEVFDRTTRKTVTYPASTPVYEMPHNTDPEEKIILGFVEDDVGTIYYRTSSSSAQFPHQTRSMSLREARRWGGGVYAVAVGKPDSDGTKSMALIRVPGLDQEAALVSSDGEDYLIVYNYHTRRRQMLPRFSMVVEPPAENLMRTQYARAQGRGSPSYVDLSYRPAYSSFSRESTAKVLPLINFIGFDVFISLRDDGSVTTSDDSTGLHLAHVESYAPGSPSRGDAVTISDLTSGRIVKLGETTPTYTIPYGLEPSDLGDRPAVLNHTEPQWQVRASWGRGREETAGTLDMAVLHSQRNGRFFVHLGDYDDATSAPLLVLAERMPESW